jgi:hypothetical protein
LGKNTISRTNGGFSIPEIAVDACVPSPAPGVFVVSVDQGLLAADAAGRAFYGRTTGVGANSRMTVAPGDPAVE